MIFEDVTANALIWRYQSRANDSAAWSDETVSRYSRRNDRSQRADNGITSPNTATKAGALARRSN